MKRRVLILLTFVGLCLVSSRQTDARQQQSLVNAQLDRKLSEIAGRKHLPGFAVSAVNKNEVIFQKGYGLADISRKTPYSAQSLQNIASISKTFIGVALMKLSEQGRINLDDDINKHLPFKVVNPNFPQNPITIRQLANHTGTLTDTKEYWENCYAVLNPAELNQGGLARDSLLKANRRISLSEFVRNLLSTAGVWYKKSNFLKQKPGTHFEYSNVGANLAGYLIERVSGESFEDYTEKHILKPVGMTHSGWAIERVNQDRFVSQYLSDMRRLPRYALVTVPDGGLITSVEDLSKYLMEAIRGYRGESKLLRPQSFRELMMPTKGGPASYAIFWEFHTDAIGHGGGDPGTKTRMYFDPKTNLGFVLFTNTSADNQASDRDFTDAQNTLLGYIHSVPGTQTSK